MADQKTVIATTVIHRATKPGVRGDPSKNISAVKPEVQIIRPGARFVPKDEAEFAELMKAGAIKMLDEPAATMAEAELERAAQKTPAKRASAKKTNPDDDLI